MDRAFYIHRANLHSRGVDLWLPWSGGLADMRRIHATSRPMDRSGPVLPMSAEDARFWQLRRERGKPVQPGILQRIFGRK